MAFAAARMIMPKDKQARKASAELPGNRNKNKQGPPPHPYVPRSGSGRPGGKPPTSRGCVKRTKGKGKKGKKGCRDTYDLIVNIDLTEWQLTDEQVAEFKEVFMLFDKDEDGVLTFPELNIVMKSLGQRPTEKDLLTMVRDVSEDHIYDTIEFNEFLQMMSKQQKFGMTEDSLKDAFRIFDKDDDGFISVEELRHIMQSLGEKMNDSELDEMIAEADSDNDGLINYEEFVQVLCSDGKSKGAKKKKKHRKKEGATDDLTTTTTTTAEVVVEDDPATRNGVDKRSNVLSSKTSSGPSNVSPAALPLKSGNGTSTISAPSTPVMPPVTPSVMPVIMPNAKLPLQTLPSKSKQVTPQPLKTTQDVTTTPQKTIMPQKALTQSKVVTSPPPQKPMTPSKIMMPQKPSSTSKVTPTITTTTKTMKPSMNGSSPLPVTLTKNSNKADLIVMEKMTNCSYATVKDNGSKK